MFRRVAMRMAPKAPAKAAEPTFSKVNGATGGEDTALDKSIVVGCIAAFAGWQLFGPPVIAHH